MSITNLQSHGLVPRPRSDLSPGGAPPTEGASGRDSGDLVSGYSEVYRLVE